MTIRTSLLTLLCLFFSLASYSQSFYYSGGKAIALHEDHQKVVVHFNNEVPESLKSLQYKHLDHVEIHLQDKRAILHFDKELATLPSLTSLGVPNTDLRSIAFGQMLDDGFSVILTHEVVLQWQPSEELDATLITRAMDEAGVVAERKAFATTILEVEDPAKGLALANQLYESGMVAWAHPDFYAKATKYQDPLYSQQFQMNNTGQTIDGFAGGNDIDVDAPEAWALTLGSSSITVAVIDDGLEAHEDLVTSSGASRVLGGYTPDNNGNGTPNASGAHGMSCAGIVAASHNGIGVQGLAPNVNLRSVNIFWGNETAQDIANGITWAKNQGVDVMSNSWGYTSCTASFDAINSAIADAANTGRGGKGCVIIFASGNGYKTCVDYPGNLSTVMAVGAVTNQGNHSDYANGGSALDIVAPSNAVSPQPGAGVRTVDRQGSAGYGSGNYTGTFGGTSAACPAVAGVAALVVSANPDLTKAQVDNILLSTADDMGANGYDTTYGNGRVNAFAAVQAAGGNNGGGGGNACTATVSSYPYSESFEGGLGAWVQASGDDLDWTRRSGSTPSSSTGPTAAAQGSFYLHVESSSPNYPSKTTNLNGPCFDLSGLNNPEISFNYHMYGSAMGTLRLQASTDGSNYTNIWTLSGDQGNSWLSATVSLAAYTNASELRLRWSGTTGSSWQGDMSVDNISVSGSTGGGGGGCTGTEVALDITLDNYPAETSWSIVDAGGAQVASGSGYSGAGTSVSETICLADGCYDFIINDSYGDGICCAFGNGSYALTDGGTVLASGGAFTTSETTNFCLGGGGAPSCPTVDFNSYTISAYGGNQDAGTSQVQNGGSTLLIQNNAWKSIALSYTVTANTVLEFDFRSTTQGEIHGIGMDSDNGISSDRTIKVHGTQNWGITNYDNYSGSSWVTYSVPLGSFYTGNYDRMFFVADHDAGASNGNSYYRNVKIYESGACVSATGPVASTVGVNPIIGNEGEKVSFGLYPNPTSASVRLLLDESQSLTSCTVFNAMGQQVKWISAQELNSDIDVSDLPTGMYSVKATFMDGSQATQQLVIAK